MSKGLKKEGLLLDKLSDPGDRYTLGEIIGTGVHANVYVATDSQEGGKNVAIKIQKITSESFPDIEEEYRILRDLSDHPNLPDFYGAYRRKDGDSDDVWLVMQLCEGGPVTDLVRALLRNNRKMLEEHIAFILREVLKALMMLHENHVIHRDIKASNVLLTKEGEVKLVDFGISRELASTMDKRQTSLGSPCWMAPEIVTSCHTKGSYDNRADVWALGITAIELGDGKAPFQDMHPTRALFQIVRNPPPTLYRPAHWSQNYNDFVAECLVKNPEYRPYMTELMQHPFFTSLPENDFHFNVELKTLLEFVTSQDVSERKSEVKVKNGRLKQGIDKDGEKMYVEDLAALETLNEDTIINNLEHRYNENQYYTYIGDILLFMNPNEPVENYGFQHYRRYKFKSRSDNEPHIYGVADSAYQDMLHHNVPQNIVLSGETMSGKTTQFKHLLKQLINLGQSRNKCGEKLQRSLEVIQAFGNASTPVNNNSTRHALITQLTFSYSGKISGGIFWVYQLEKWRVTGNRCPYHTNFHIFYYLVDGLRNEGLLERYGLEDKDYRYLRRNIDEKDRDPKAPSGPRDEKETNVDWFKQIDKSLDDLDFSADEKDAIWRILSAIILLGEIEYKEEQDGNADISNLESLDKVASVLQINSKRLSWALCNYCVLEKDVVSRRRHSKAEATEARNVLAQTIYSRLVDWIVNMINKKLSLSRAVYGDSHCINILDMFGFECYSDNGLEQIFVNSLNEQLQFFYNQKIFISEMQDEEEDEVQIKKLQFYDNKCTIDELLNKPNGIMHILDEANKLHLDEDFLVDWLKKKKKETDHVKAETDDQFSVAHYTGKVTYEAVAMCGKNRDFLPPEITEVMRLSTEPIIKQMFTNKLSRTGNVTVLVDSDPKVEKKKSRWGSALFEDTTRKIRRYNTASKGEFSQTKGIRTAATIFRATSLEILKLLSEGSTHFVRCIRTDLNSAPKGFQHSIIKQQLRALSVVETAGARQVGFSHRIAFDDFLERYQFLAFDFEESVDKTKDNCRLLLIRLKMEGWTMGNKKVFLKYYNEEFLSRLYETQVNKIIKIQSMLRGFLAKKNVAHKRNKPENENSQTVRTVDLEEGAAAVIIQKNMKGFLVRKKFRPLLNTSTGKLDPEVAEFIRVYFKKWKSKSIYQTLLLYRAAKHHDVVYFCQQVHLYNQSVVGSLFEKNHIETSLIETDVDEEMFIGRQNDPVVWKLPFDIKDINYCDSSFMCGSVYDRKPVDELPSWDDPFKSLNKGCQTEDAHQPAELLDAMKRKNKRYRNFIDTPYSRDSSVVEENNFQEFDVEPEDWEPIVEKHEQETDEKHEQGTVKTEEQDKVETHEQEAVNQVENSEIKDVVQETQKQVRIDTKPQYIPKTDLSQKESLIENGTADFRKILKPTKNINKISPLTSELLEKGKSLANTNEDEPPYNFQHSVPRRC
ncbi:neither inactivation nor afterpotential protein C isoform X2 [Cimex lectularius]|uniref:non-specific serine/threonine protein kinase n=1 Tax=Cimex lectularius TaxID=79782 RepID=A0A8I6RQW2_CIMLE|nr:neither inactivation nor afterpotential protein C isoform X2 [Cimex lectularius]